jgi:hypothetical protein
MSYRDIEYHQVTQCRSLPELIYVRYAWLQVQPTMEFPVGTGYHAYVADTASRYSVGVLLYAVGTVCILWVSI